MMRNQLLLSKLANRIIEDAYVLGASDIHVEPREVDLVVRYRIDGVCQEKLKLPPKVAGSASGPLENHVQSGYR